MTRIAEVLVQPIEPDYIVIVNEETGEEVTIPIARAERIAQEIVILSRRILGADHA